MFYEHIFLWIEDCEDLAICIWVNAVCVKQKPPGMYWEQKVINKYHYTPLGIARISNTELPGLI
jgi:hypothetical protein